VGVALLALQKVLKKLIKRSGFDDAAMTLAWREGHLH
jgi:hypothetical protein